VWFFRIAALVGPLVVFQVSRRVCRELAAAEAHPLRAWSGAVVTRNATGGFSVGGIDDGEMPASELAGARDG